MSNFKSFLEEEQEKDVKETLEKLPKSHKKLIKGYKIEWQCGNNLNGDEKHVGVINAGTKTITICSPYFHSREFTLLHEIAHLVFEKFIRNTELQKRWEFICENTKNKKKNENAEELFCHAYANTYTKNKVSIHDHPIWEKFIKNLPS